MPSSGVLLSWLPALMTLLLSAVAVVAVALSRTPTGRRIGLGSIALVGALSVAVALWQASAAAERIAELVRRDRSQELAAEVASLRAQLASLKASTRFRALGGEVADRLAAYLRPYGPHRVVVSCASDDVEAYRYATEIADALKAAGWDARGPEPTAIFGDLRSMSVNLYDNGGSDTAKILTAAMQKLAIPYQVRVPPVGTLPAGEAVEVYVGSKPGAPATDANAASR